MSTIKGTHGQLLEAVSLAARAHQGQFRKDGKTPYASHPFRVCLVVRDIFGFDDRRMLLAAILHDTVEDTTTDFDDLADKFGPEVAQWVALLTKDKRLPEGDREQAYCQALQQAPWQVQVCKLADMFDNLMDLGNLPPERRENSLKRAAHYLSTFKDQKAAELQAPLAMVTRLFEECRAQSGKPKRPKE